MAATSRFPLLACAIVLLLAGCYTGPGYDPTGPRNFQGLLVDPRTGITLPGQDDYCLFNRRC